MKMSVQDEVFKPVTITLETKEELNAIFYIALSNISVPRMVSESFKGKVSYSCLEKFCDNIISLIKENKLKEDNLKS